MMPRTAGAHYHLAGVAGVGMSALAEFLLGRGCRVTGSDRDLDSGRDLPVFLTLRRAGVGLRPQDGSGVRERPDALVVSSAIEGGNPDLDEAGVLGVPVVHRAHLLAEAAKGMDCVAVAGTSGKTTVTGMIGWILEQAGRDPTVVNGGSVIGWAGDDRTGSVRMGKSGTFVVEADESDRSLLEFDPARAVITNMSKDHFGEEETRALFDAFRERVTGAVICGEGDHGSLRGFDPAITAEGCSFSHGGESFAIGLPGRHNAENALLSAVLCETMGVGSADSAAALAGFRGIARRLQTVGRVSGVTVVDDYAHNPAKIRAAWNALAPYYERVTAVWRPHGYGPLAAMMEDLVALFTSLLRAGDALCVLPVYDAGGTADRSIRADALVERLAGQGVNALAVDGFDEAERLVVQTCSRGSVALVMGARDPDLPGFCARLVSSLG